jgi:hypothetical protein
MGCYKASKSPPSGSWLRRKEKVRGLHALPTELIKNTQFIKKPNSTILPNSDNQIAAVNGKQKTTRMKSGSGGCVSFIKTYSVF